MAKEKWKVVGILRMFTSLGNASGVVAKRGDEYYAIASGHVLEENDTAFIVTTDGALHKKKFERPNRQKDYGVKRISISDLLSFKVSPLNHTGDTPSIHSHFSDDRPPTPVKHEKRTKTGSWFRAKNAVLFGESGAAIVGEDDELLGIVEATDAQDDTSVFASRPPRKPRR